MTRQRLRSNRRIAIQRVRQRLLATSFPRAQMSLIVLLTGGFGFLSSFVLLQYGLGSMALRYPLALGCAYLFFLLLIWLWLRTNAADYLDAPALPDGVPGRVPTGAAPEYHGAGGEFGGGGASASFEEPAVAASDALDGPLESVGDAAGAIAEADELVIPLIAVLLALGLAFASLYVIYIAPMLLAEVLVDGALTYGLFRFLGKEEQPHWIASTVRRTLLPFVLTALFLAAAGAGLAAYAPGAQSIGQVLHGGR